MPKKDHLNILKKYYDILFISFNTQFIQIPGAEAKGDPIATSSICL